MTQEDAILEILREGNKFTVRDLIDAVASITSTDLMGAQLRKMIEDGTIIHYEQIDGRFYLIGSETF